MRYIPGTFDLVLRRNVRCNVYETLTRLSLGTRGRFREIEELYPGSHEPQMQVLSQVTEFPVKAHSAQKHI
jgi:hypothetical protein